VGATYPSIDVVTGRDRRRRGDRIASHTNGRQRIAQVHFCDRFTFQEPGALRDGQGRGQSTVSMRPLDEPAAVAGQPASVRTGTLALMLGGGGARGAYQAGVLRGIARQFPDLRFPILTGISAGAVNTIHLASRDVPLAQSTNELVALWLGLTPQRIFDVRAGPEPMRGMVDSDPLRQFLQGHHKPDFSGLARNRSRAIGD